MKSRCIKPTFFLQTISMDKIKIFDSEMRTRDERETLSRFQRPTEKNKTTGAGMQ